MLHQLLKAMERSGLSLVDGALALVTHSLNAPTPLLSLHATWFLCTPHPFRPPQPPLTEHKRKSPHPSPPCVGPPHPSSLCLCPSLASFPLPHPKGTRYPSPTHSPRHSSSICLSSFQWPVTSFHFPCDCCWIIHAPNPPFVMIFFLHIFFSSFLICSDIWLCLSLFASAGSLFSLHLTNKLPSHILTTWANQLISGGIQWGLCCACLLVVPIFPQFMPSNYV